MQASVRQLLLETGGGPGWLVSGVGVATSLAQLGTMLNANPSADVTMLGDYDAKRDGTLTGCVVTQPYLGTFDGKGFTLSNLRIVDTATGSSVANAMFGQIDGTLQNMNFTNGYVYSNGAYSAVICAILDGIIDNCDATGAVYNNGISSKLAVGVSFVRDGELKNGLYGGEVYALNTGDYHGGICALAYGAVTDCGWTGVTDSRSVPINIVSGLPGGSWNGAIGVIGNTVGNQPDTHDTAIITRCWSTGVVRAKVAVSSQSYGGGIFGWCGDGTVIDCWSTATITGGNVLGGLGGRSQGGRIRRSWATGTATGTENKIGTLIGHVDKVNATSPTSVTIGTGSKLFSDVYQVNLLGAPVAVAYAFTVGMEVRAYSKANPANYMQGTVTAATFGMPSDVTVDVASVGGAGTFTDWIIEGTYSSVSECWASGNATGVGTVGMFGYVSTYAEIEDVFNYGNALSSGAPYAGGLAGQLQGTISTSYSIGGVAASGSFGGAIGNLNVSGVTVDCYWDTTTTGLSNASGTGTPSGVTGLTTVAFKAALPTGFGAAWTRDGAGVIAGGYPYLVNVTAPAAPNIIPPPSPTQIFLTGSGNWTVPSDVPVGGVIVECIGAGGNGGTASTTSPGRGGGGGAYAKTSSLTFTPGASIPYVVGTGGSGTATNFNSGQLIAAAGANGSSTAAGAGGTTGASTGTVKYAGGGGGSAANACSGGGGGGSGSSGGTGRAGASGAGNATNCGGGGGGAAGGGEVGVAGTSAGGGNGGEAADSSAGGTGSTDITVDGGAGSSGSGGGGGYAADADGSAGGAGGAGTEYNDGSGTAGAGGGGGGGGGDSALVIGGAGGAGGAYGAGGGGGGRATGTPGTGGAGGAGIIVITYTPAS